MSPRQPAPRSELERLLRQLEEFLQSPVDLTDRRFESRVVAIRYLSGAAIYLNLFVVARTGGRAGPTRGVHLVEQIVGAAFQTFDGEDIHADSFEKAAMLLRGITQGHPFEDGNKRTGFLLAEFYLRRVGIALPDAFPVDAAEELCVRVSSGQVRDVEQIANELERLWQP